jgi:hypothetical protein
MAVSTNEELTGITENLDLVKRLILKGYRNTGATNYKKGPANVAPLWTASEVVSVGDVRRLSNGKTIICQIAGTTGTIQPPVTGSTAIVGEINPSNTLTVASVANGGLIGIGTEILTGGATAGTRISAYGTGTGGTGTYTLTGNSATVTAGTNMACLNNPSGRPITDNTATWYEDYIVKSTSDVDAIVGKYVATASTAEIAARYGFTRVTLGSPNYTQGNLLLYLRSKCGIDGVIPFVAQSIDYRVQSTSTSYDSFAASYGYPIGMKTSVGSEFEFIVTDTAFGLEFNTGTGGGLYSVMVNGQHVTGSPIRTNNGNSQVIVYDFGGKLTRAIVKLRPTVTPESRISALHITSLGKLENGVKSQDTLLCLGDSMWDTVSPTASGIGVFNSLGTNVKNNLGFDGVVVANAGGTGYVATGGAFTLPQMVSDSTNQALFRSYNINHVIVATSLNDNAQTPSVVGAAALSSWQTIRSILPNAKITIYDAWYHDATNLANRQAIVTELKNAFAAWSDTNSRFITNHGSDGLNSVIYGTGNSTSTTTSTAIGTRAKIIGSDNTHFSIPGINFMSDYITNTIIEAWDGDY